jgi:beta-lactamase superfamily II metal-dependent hydrolase
MRLPLLLFAMVVAAAVSFRQSPKTLEIYSIDVEGGKSTLVISPTREAMLIDTGNIGEGASRDAERILAAIKDAGLTQLHYLMTTHWHRDHIGGMALVASRVPVREFIDHGPNTQPDPPVDSFIKQEYPGLYSRSKHTVPKPGHRISIHGFDVTVVASAGRVLRSPLPGAGQANAYCPARAPSPDKTENAQSIGIHMAFGKFRALDLADLSTDREFELMCPRNAIGAVDLFMVSHHGQTQANSEALVHAIQPRVAIMNNGTRKGGQPEVMKTLYTAPRLENLWQLHFSLLSGQEFTAPGLFIANGFDQPQTAMPLVPVTLPPAGEHLASPPPAHDGAAYWIKVVATEDGSFTVTNSRNNFSRRYPAD